MSVVTDYIAMDRASVVSDNGWNNATGVCAETTSSTPIEGAAVCVNGRAVYLPAIWAALNITRKGRAKIENNRCVCLKRKQERRPDDIAPYGAMVDDNTLDTRNDTDYQNELEQPSTTTSSGMSTGTKVAIGVGVGAVVLIGIFAGLSSAKKAK